MTDPMTPTEQDKELQKAVWASLASQITHAINCTDLEHEEQDSCEDFTKKNFEQLMQLITADRKRVALEARIDTATDILYGFSRTYKQEVTDSAGNVYVDESHGYISKYEVQELVAKLKAQQEDKVDE